MPHFVVEYSANIARDHDLTALGKLIRDTTVETGLFPLAGCRVRFHEADPYIIADGHEDNRALSVIMRVGQGRDLPSRQAAGQKIFDAICAFLGTREGHDLVSLEIVEIESETSFKKNTILPRLKSAGTS